MGFVVVLVGWLVVGFFGGVFFKEKRGKKKKKQHTTPHLRKGLHITVSDLSFRSKPTVKYMFWLSGNPGTDAPIKSKICKVEHCHKCGDWPFHYPYSPHMLKLA